MPEIDKIVFNIVYYFYISYFLRSKGNESFDIEKQLREYLAEVLPDFDRDRVYTNVIKKLILWYNILVSNGITDFGEETAVEAE